MFDTIYPYILATHNIVRWIVLIIAILAVVRAIIGYFGKHAWIPADPKIGSWLAMFIDIQLLLGIILIIYNYVSIGTLDPRIWMEHVIPMLLAVIFAHLGSALPKRVDTPHKKHRRALIWRGLTLLVIIIAIPWWRPLLPAIFS